MLAWMLLLNLQLEDLKLMVLQPPLPLLLLLHDKLAHKLEEIL